MANISDIFWAFFLMGRWLAVAGGKIQSMTIQVARSIQASLLFTNLAILFLCLSLYGCAGNIRQTDLENAFDNSLSRYADYMAQCVAQGVSKAIFGLYVHGNITIDEPERIISETIISSCQAQGIFDLRLLSAESERPIKKPLPVRIDVSKGMPFLSIIGLIVLITIGLFLLVKFLLMYLKLRGIRLGRSPPTMR